MEGYPASTYEQMNNDRLLAVAAGVVFYGLLALFPAITALVSSYALFAKGSTINEHLSSLGSLLPGGAMDIVRDQADRVLAKGDVKLGTAFLFSFLLAVWSANGGMKAVIDALNVAYEEKEERGSFGLTRSPLHSPSAASSPCWWQSGRSSPCRWSSPRSD